MDISDFLCDVFCVNDLSDVRTLSSVLDIESSCLNYNALFNHPRVKTATLFVHLFADTFGFFPSRAFACDILTNIDTWDTSIVLPRFVSNTFLKYVRNETNLSKAFEKAKYNATTHLHIFNNSPLQTKNLIWQWLARDFYPHLSPNIENTTLFAAAKEHLTRRILNKGFVDVTVGMDNDRLAWNDISIQCPYAYDKNAHHIILNMNFYRTFLGRIVMKIDDNIDFESAIKLTNAVSSHFKKDRIVVIASQSHIEYVLANISSNIKTVRSDTLVPKNIAALCIHVTTNNAPNFSMGQTPLRRIVVVRSSECDNLMLGQQNSVVAFQDNSNRFMIAEYIRKILPQMCIPLYCDSEIVQAYLKMYMEIDASNEASNEVNINRAIVYASLIPQIPSNDDMKSLTPTTKNNKRYTIMIIDTRSNPLSILSILIAYMNTNRDDWDVVISTSKASKDFYATRIPWAKFFDHPCLDKSPFDLEAYNEYLKLPDIWTYLNDQGYERCMLIQDDGMLVRSGVESSGFLEYTLVGAPWLTCTANQELVDLTQARMVGNGGFCLRCPKDMLSIATKYADVAGTLFNNKLQPIQEDVFFAKFAASTPPSVEEASLFSTEQIMNETSFGFHKLWMYHPQKKILSFANILLSSYTM